MTASLLATKLFIPHPQADLVLRPRLLHELDEGLRTGARLILISAPAGYGKTTLIAEWAQKIKDEGGRVKDGEGILHSSSFRLHPLHFAWLSLEKDDNDPLRFWTYVIAAIQSAHPGFGQGILQGLQSPNPAGVQAVMTDLINELAGIQDHTVLVLDDYHAITSPVIHTGVAFLLDHLPSQFTLVIASRTDPPLPLARLRARGQLVNLRSDDLRFTLEETALFLEKRLGLTLPLEDIAALEARTEGWIAGLQMAAFSLRGHSDASAFIQAFSGSNRYILDYLIEEVLARQPELVQSFLLQTSILDRMCASLIDVLLESREARIESRPEGMASSDDSRLSTLESRSTTLEYIDRLHLFLIPLDDTRTWYRYHHLFADLLRARLRQAMPERIPELHGRASAWFEANGFVEEAIRHALLAGDASRAADLVEADLIEKITQKQFSTTFWQVKDLPAAALSARPMLAICRAFECTFSGEYPQAQPLLDQAQAALDAAAAQGKDNTYLRGFHAAVGAILAEVTGDYARVVELARQADHLLPQGDVFQTVVPYTLGKAALAAGDLAAAEAAVIRQREMALATGEISTIGVATATLADLRMLQGRLHEAADLYREIIGRVTHSRGTWVGNVANLRIPLGGALMEWNDLEGVRKILNESLGVLQGIAYPLDLARARLLEAQLRLCEGEPQAAQEALNRALDASRRVPASLEFEVEATVVQIRIGLFPEYSANAWMQAEQKAIALAEKAGQPLLQELLHIALARLYRAQERSEEAMSVLEPVLVSTETGGRLGRQIEALTLLALAYQELGRSEQARDVQLKALRLGEPEGYIRVFLDEGQKGRLLIDACRLMIEKDSNRKLLSYVDRIRSGFAETESPPPQPRGGMAKSSPLLVEPLTEREMEVLGLIAQGLTNQAIADQLVVSVGTVKRHTANIYGKLEVTSRTQAVARAREVGLVG